MKAHVLKILFINLGSIIFIGNSVFAGVDINEIIKNEDLRTFNLFKIDIEQGIIRIPNRGIKDIYNEISKNPSSSSYPSIQHLPQRPDGFPDNQEGLDQHFLEPCVNSEEILLHMISAQLRFEKRLKELEKVEEKELLPLHVLITLDHNLREYLNRDLNKEDLK